ncbi:LOG family protein [Chitinophaga silvisoli]|uniref:Cytokinin riboside 5'-monophosphate phosphoribohydrolase n=1 Tax=Chitinophaga silvisoli TaxID=2291814 RepID=A0A3E1NX93_9BACT|nr:TIGR00730 family Rossman fold protein [Chitinophaga silvisoli]RFM32540.1 TIGR00730 family Rossman fold protein [Chitinophaga silvisoli]
MISTFKSAAVFCGSKPGLHPLFAQHASTLGKLLALHRVTLIYGGGNTGLMGIVANEVLDNEGEAIGVMPDLLIQREFRHDKLTQFHIVEDMHARKKLMYSLSEAVIILPGGIGTFDEMIEVMAWNSLSIHNKKIYVINSDGFFDLFIQQMYKLQEHGFLYSDVSAAFEVVSSPEMIFK